MGPIRAATPNAVMAAPCFSGGKASSKTPWLLGWSPEFGKFNVSELLFLHSMRAAAREGLHTYDFVRGNEPYKFRFAAEPHVLRSRQWAVTTRGKIAVGANRIAERVLASARRWRTRAQRVAQKLRRVKA